MSIFRTAVVAAGILVASAAAQAATVSYGTTPASTSTLTTGLQTTNFTSSLTLPKFNSTLGTLTSVAIGHRQVERRPAWRSRDGSDICPA